MGQQRVAEYGMDKPGDLEQKTVGPREENRQNGRFRLSDYGANKRIPFGIRNRAFAQVEVRHVVSREGHECAPGPDPFDGLPDCTGVGRVRIRDIGIIDRDDPAADAGKVFEKMVAEKFRIRPDLGENVAQHNAFKAAKGMVGYNHQRALGGNSFEIVANQGVADFKVVQAGLEKAVLVGLEKHFLIDPAQLPIRETALHRVFENGRQPPAERMAKMTLHIQPLDDPSLFGVSRRNLVNIRHELSDESKAGCLPRKQTVKIANVRIRTTA